MYPSWEHGENPVLWMAEETSQGASEVGRTARVMAYIEVMRKWVTTGTGERGTGGCVAEDQMARSLICSAKKLTV